MSLYNGISLLILRPDQYQAEYGCANISTTISISANTHPMLSICQLCLAIVSEILYGLCMYSIWKHLQLSCYKILFYIGINDMLALFVGAILCSAMALNGVTFCDFPLIQYFTGGLAIAFWFAESTSEFILAFNLCLEVLLPAIAVTVFKENRTWHLMAFPSVYALFSWLFTRPLIFSTTKFAFFFNPYEDYNSTTASSNYSNIMYTFNNTLVLCVLCSIYAIFCVLWICRMIKMLALANPSMASTTTATSTNQNGISMNNTKTNSSNNVVINKSNSVIKQHNSTSSSSMVVQLSFLQFVFITFFNAAAAGLGVYMEHFDILPETIVAAHQFTYLLTHAATPFIYIICNRKIRADIYALFYRILNGQNLSIVTVVGRHNEGQITRLMVPIHTQNVGIERPCGTVPIIAAEHWPLHSNGVPLFRRAISGADTDASSGIWPSPSSTLANTTSTAL